MANDIGYGKPPKSRRFKKGQSGNPKGRPKGAKNVRTLVEKTVNQKVSISVDGRRRSTTALDAMIQTIMAQALKGNAKAQSMMLQLLAQYLTDMTTQQPVLPTTAEDLELLKRGLARFRHLLKEA